MINFMITLAVAIVFALIALRLRIPAGALLGAILGVVFLNSFTTMAYFPMEIKILSTAWIGAYVGCNVSRRDVKQMKIIGKPVLLMVFVMFLYNLGTSIILTRFSDIDFTTAFLAMAPGGIADMSLVALDMGANAPAVTTIQMMRLIVVIMLSPFAIKANITHFRKKGYPEELLVEPVKIDAKAIDIEMDSERGQDKSNNKKFAVTIIVSLLVGILGKLSGFPAGNLLFPILAITAINLIKEYAYMSTNFRRFAQMLSGALIGIQFSVKDLFLIWDAIIPVMLLVAGWLLLNQILGLMLNRWAKIPLITSLFATAAGGLTDMGIIAAELSFFTPLLFTLFSN